MSRSRLPRPRLPAALIAVLLLGTLAPLALAGDDVNALRLAYEAAARRRDDRGFEEQREILVALADRRSLAAREVLQGFRERYATGEVRRSALILGALARHATPEELDALVAWVEERHLPPLTERLAEILGGVQAPATRAHLREDALPRATPVVKAQIAAALGTIGEAEAVPALLRLLTDVNLRVRIEAVDALGRIGDARALSPLVVFSRDGESALRAAIARALGMIGGDRAGPALVQLLEDEAPRVVEAAATSLGMLGGPQGVARLIEVLERVHEEDLRVADAVTRALQRLSGKAFGTDPEPWKSWWAAVKDRTWVVPESDPAGVTVTGARYYGFPIRSSRVVFVLDNSRSMGWNERLETAKDELIRVLETLPAKTHFNIIVYSDRSVAWQTRLRPASKSYVRRAMGFVEKQRPDNGTNTYSALARAFADEDADTIFILSDGHPSVGEVTDPDRILADVREWNRNRDIRIHCLALIRGLPPPSFAGREDASRAAEFMQRLAEENRGDFKLIR